MNAETTTSNNHQATRTPEQGASAAATAHAGMHLGGYVVISFVATVLALATAHECQSITHLPSLVYGIVLWGWWGVIASALWELGARKPAVSSFSLMAISLHVLVGAVLGVLHLLALWSLGFTGLGWYANQTPQAAWHSLLNLNRYGIEILIYGFVFGIIGIIQYQIRAQQEAMKSLELQRQLSAAQLRALQTQLEPHRTSSSTHSM
jgi:hypothetical protein